MIGVTICTKCKGVKEDTGSSYCSSCRRDRGRTKKSLIDIIYASQKSSSKGRGHKPPDYTKEVFSDWLMGQALFHELYDKWVDSDYKSELKPSVDRKKDDVHYCITNIQLTDWGTNRAKTFTNIEVFRRGKSLGRFSSISQANRELDGIGRCSLIDCLYKNKRIKGYTVAYR